jgi:glycosyltransferase involved in cell wall biosynthesis
MDCPKVLVLSHNSFSKVANNGKTFESIFKYFPKEKLAQVFFSENENPDFDFCENYFKITDTNVLKSLLNGYSDCGTVPSSKQNQIHLPDTNSEKASKLFRYAKSKSDYMVFFRDLLWACNSWKSKAFLHWSKTFNPDVVFYVGGNFGFSHAIAQFIANYLKVPLVCYFTDDYLIYPNNKNLLDGIQRWRMKKFYTKTVQQSSLCFVIGEEMAKEYSAYFGKQFYPIMNSIEKQAYVPYVERKEIIFSYFGGLHLNRWKMLIRLAQSIPTGTLNVYAVEKPSEEILLQFERENIQFKGGVRGENLVKAILETDVLLHVESDDSYNRALTKLSVSTKIPEYLMSGRLIVGFGPDDVASMKILSENKIGIVISSQWQDKRIKLELEKITSNFELRKQMGLRGYAYAIAHFDNEQIAKEFKNKLEKLKLK